MKNRKRTIGVHVAVLLDFRGLPPDGYECRHLDGCPANNRLNNLCWGTRKEQQDDVLKHGRRRMGDTHHHHRFTTQEVQDIRREYAPGKIASIARGRGVSWVSIKRMVTRQTYRHVS